MRIALLFLILFLCGCAGERVAQKRAELVNKEVLRYEKDLDDFLQGERETYERLAITYKEGWESLWSTKASDLRYIEALRFTEKIQHQKDLTYGELIDFLKKTSDVELQMYRETLDKKRKIEETHKKAYAEIQLNKDKIIEVRNASGRLSTKPTLRKRVKNINDIVMKALVTRKEQR